MKTPTLVSVCLHWASYQPPGALTATGWRLFRKEFKEVAPIRYWLQYTLPEMFRPIRWKYDEISSWIGYRTTARYHRIDTGLPPGYNGIDEIMLHTNFTLLKNFVEKEIAGRQAWHDETYIAEKRYTKFIPFYRMFVTFRRPDLGIKHLQWEMTLDDPSLPPYDQSPAQAEAARETFALYDWWVNVRSNRKLPDLPHYSDQQLGSLSRFDDVFDSSAADYIEYDRVRRESDKIEEEWSIEDTDMLVRLVKHRANLWS